MTSSIESRTSAPTMPAMIADNSWVSNHRRNALTTILTQS